MRIKIGLKAVSGTVIPIEYQYALYLGLRRLLFAHLKVKKPKAASQYKRKLPDFTFSQLQIPQRRVETGLIHIDSPYFSISLSSDDDRLVEHLLLALPAAGNLAFFGRKFPIAKVEVIEDPEFTTGELRGRMTSPMLLARHQDGKVQFLTPHSPDLNAVFTSELLTRYSQTQGAMPAVREVRFDLDQGYLARAKSVTRLITVRGTHFRLIWCPFTLQAAPEVLRFAYRAGLGERRQYGFGMFELLGGDLRDGPN